MGKPDFKLYTHHETFMRYRDERGSLSVKKILARLPRFFFDALMGACIKVGRFFYSGAIIIIRSVANEFSGTAASVRLRFSKERNAFLTETLTVFLCIALLSYAGIAGFKFLAKGLDFKNKLLNVGKKGEQALLLAKTDLENNNFTGAESKFLEAYESFTLGQQRLEQENAALTQLLNLLPQKQDSDLLFEAAALLSVAGGKMTLAYQNISNWNLAQSGISGTGVGEGNITETSELVNQALVLVDSAGGKIASVNPKSLPKSLREKLALVSNDFDILQKAFHGLDDLLALAAGFGGGDKRILVLMENNNELRAGGGFIGTFAYLKIREGSLEAINVSSVYDLDGQLREKIWPPFPMLAVNDRWYLRDSNWFASWPESAKKISGFYEKEGGETPDSVVAMTPSIIQNILKLTGPVTLPRYGVTLTADNFVEVTQVESSVNYSKVDNKPKQILADLVPVLLSKLGSLPKEQTPELLQILQQALNQKQLALYSRDENTQGIISSFNWGGQVLTTDRDYLQIVSANLNGSKTDLFLKQSVELKTRIEINGEIFNELAITRTNTMPDLENAVNSSYIRILVPDGSTLAGNSGFDYNTSTPENLSSYQAAQGLAGYKIDPDVAAWEKTIVKDPATGANIGREAGKTFFGNWMVVRGGQTKTVRLTYKLPFTLKDLDHFSLLAQKQMGALPSDFSYELNFPSRELKWKNFEAGESANNQLQYNGKLDKDYLMGAVLKK